jgi:hypothetical protein
MSGGHFDYIQYRISQAADEVCQYIRRCESDERDEYGYKPEFSKETLEKFRECELTLRRASVMLHRVDYLASGDDGEDQFHSCLERDLLVFGQKDEK